MTNKVVINAAHRYKANSATSAYASTRSGARVVILEVWCHSIWTAQGGGD